MEHTSSKQCNKLDQYLLERILLFIPCEQVCKSDLVCKQQRMEAYSDYVWKYICAIYSNENDSVCTDTSPSNNNAWMELFILKYATTVKGFPLKDVTISEKFRTEINSCCRLGCRKNMSHNYEFYWFFSK